MIKNDTLIKVTGQVRYILHNVITGETFVSEWKNNLFTDAGAQAIARRLIDDTSIANTGIVTYGAVGTNTTLPLASDTILGTEIERAVTTSKTAISGIATQRTFFDKADAIGTIVEFALFGEAATGSADSGTMYNHIAIGPIVKTSAVTLTVEAKLTIS